HRHTVFHLFVLTVPPTTRIYPLSLHDARSDLSEAAALAAAARALGGEGKDRVVLALRQTVPADRRGSFDELCGRIYAGSPPAGGSEEHTSELQSPCNLVCRLLLEKKNAQLIRS